MIIGAIVVAILGHAYKQGGFTLAGQQVKNALVLGAIYALVAIGYTMVYGIIELINFAHGDVFTAAGFFAVFISGLLHLDSLAASSFGGLLLALAIVFPLSMIGAGIVGVVIELVAYRRLRDSPRLAPLITAIGVSFLIEGILLLVEGPDNVPTDQASWINGTRPSRSARSTSSGHGPLRHRHGTGADVRARRIRAPHPARQGDALDRAGQDRRAALRHQHQSHDLGDVLHRVGARSGRCCDLQHQLRRHRWNIGFHLGIIAFTAAVLGGIGNIVGAGIGGFIIGVIYVFGGSIFGGEWSESLIFAVLVLILTFRPVGLFGVEVTTRA